MDVIGKREAMSFILSSKYLVKYSIRNSRLAILTDLLENHSAPSSIEKQAKIEAELEAEEQGGRDEITLG